jgi:signal transduction histidine kinase
VASAIEDRVKVLEKMTRDFIQFSRSYHLKLRAEDIHQILDHVLENMESRTKFQSVNVEKNYAPALPPVPLDRDLMEEIFGNLFDNAVEAMGGPGVLRIRTERTAQGIMLDVSDTGPAIPPEVREHLFEPFYTTKDSGTGLGLAIVRRVVESFGGRISLLPTQATTFRIELPVSPADAAPEEAEAWKNA